MPTTSKQLMCFLVLPIIVVYAMIFSPLLMAVDCIPANITLNSQADVNDFQADFGGGGVCDSVTGSLLIDGSEISDLEPLSDLISVGSELMIINTQSLSSLEGLSGIISVGEQEGGGLAIIDNGALTNLDDLSGLAYLGNLLIHNNGSLNSLDGISGITSIEGGLEIVGNPSLTNLSGLSNLNSVTNSIYLSGTSLTDLNGLSALVDVGSSITITDNVALENLDGLSGLTVVNQELTIMNNKSLTSLVGLSELTNVNGDLTIDSNLVLSELSGLENLTGVGGRLTIQSNPILTSLDGLSALISVDAVAKHFPYSLVLKDNFSLSSCIGLTALLDNVDDGQPGPGEAGIGIPDIYWMVKIEGNLPGCNSVSEILKATTLYSVGGSVKDLLGSGLVLQNNGGDDLGIVNNGGFTFATKLVDDSDYNVTVKSQPTDPEQICTVQSGDGIVRAANVTNVQVECLTVGFSLNSGFNDAWYNPLTDGQGFFVTVYPDAGLVFLSWFTYDTTLPPEDATAEIGNPGHRWLTAVGTFSGNQAVLNVTFTSNGLFDKPTEVVNNSEGQGTITLAFEDCLSGTIEYDLTPLDKTGTVPIERIVNDNISLCEMLSKDSVAQQEDFGQLSRPTSHIGSELLELTQMNAGLNDAWFNPETNGQGFFITVYPDIELVFLSWFTFDTELPTDEATFNLPDPGNRWMTAAGTIDDNQAVMVIDITSGGLFDTTSDVEHTDPTGSDGTITLTFDNCNSGTVEYDVKSIAQIGTVPIERIVTDNIALCELLGNQ